MEDIYHKCGGGGGDTQYQLKMSSPKFHIIFAGIKRKCNWDWVPDEWLVILQESETDSSLSLAPTEIYQSPLDSPWSRSMIDLTLDSEIDKFELRQRMNLTLDEINKRGKISYMCMFSYICLFLVRKYIHRYILFSIKVKEIQYFTM